MDGGVGCSMRVGGGVRGALGRMGSRNVDNGERLQSASGAGQPLPIPWLSLGFPLARDIPTNTSSLC